MRQEGMRMEMKVWQAEWWRAGENHWGSVSAKADLINTQQTE